MLRTEFQRSIWQRVRLLRPHGLGNAAPAVLPIAFDAHLGHRRLHTVPGAVGAIREGDKHAAGGARAQLSGRREHVAALENVERERRGLLQHRRQLQSVQLTLLSSLVESILLVTIATSTTDSVLVTLISICFISCLVTC